MKKIIISIICIILLPYNIFPDRTVYQKRLSINIESENYLIIHLHDWSRKFAYIVIINKNTGYNTIVFQTPALTRLFLSEDENYIVGFSNIKINNQYQLIIMNITGEYILRKNINANESNNFTETVTNYVFWYNENIENIQFIFENETLSGISLIDNIGERINIYINEE